MGYLGQPDRFDGDLEVTCGMGRENRRFQLLPEPSIQIGHGPNGYLPHSACGDSSDLNGMRQSCSTSMRMDYGIRIPLGTARNGGTVRDDIGSDRITVPVKMKLQFSTSNDSD
jgi:hypothetical protein